MEEYLVNTEGLNSKFLQGEMRYACFLFKSNFYFILKAIKEIHKDFVRVEEDI